MVAEKGTRHGNPATEPLSVDGIQAIVQRLKPHGQTDRQQTRPVAGLPGQPPSLTYSLLGFLVCVAPTLRYPPRTRPPVFPSPLRFFSSLFLRDGGSGTGRFGEERGQGNLRKVPRIFHLHFHSLDDFHFPFALLSSPPSACMGSVPAQPPRCWDVWGSGQCIKIYPIYRYERRSDSAWMAPSASRPRTWERQREKHDLCGFLFSFPFS